jgi:hypothetical protein
MKYAIMKPSAHQTYSFSIVWVSHASEVGGGAKGG